MNLKSTILTLESEITQDDHNDHDDRAKYEIRRGKIQPGGDYVLKNIPRTTVKRKIKGLKSQKIGKGIIGKKSDRPVKSNSHSFLDVPSPSHFLSLHSYIHTRNGGVWMDVNFLQSVQARVF